MIIPKNPAKAIAGLYDLLPIGSPEIVRTADLAKAIGVGAGEINRVRRFLVSIGAMTCDVYKNPRSGEARTTYTLLDTPEELARKIANSPYPTFSHWLAEVGGEKSLYTRGTINPYTLPDETVLVVEAPPEPVVMTTSFPEPKSEPIKTLEALAPFRKSEPRAYVEATRQYIAQWDIAKSHAQALFDAHLIDDTGVILDSLKLEHRPDMDAVAQVLPYIDELEKRIANLDKFQDTLKAKTERGLY